MSVSTETRRRNERQLDFAPALLKSQLQLRLEEEGEFKLARRLERCGEEVPLLCVSCGVRRGGLTHCDAKWCPLCQRRVAARNKERVWPVVSKFQWPLHVTLTSRNTASIDGLRRFRAAFTKFRRWKLWTQRVAGGVCGYELTERGNGYHPHAHLLLDCRWLSLDTPEPPRGANKYRVDVAKKSAHDELSRMWAKACGQRDGAIVWVKRTAVDTALEETLKYSLKTDQVLAMPGKIGPVIHALNSIRSMTTFGSAYKIGKRKVKAPCKCGNCGQSGSIVLESEAAAIIRKHRW